MTPEIIKLNSDLEVAIETYTTCHKLMTLPSDPVGDKIKAIYLKNAKRFHDKSVIAIESFNISQENFLVSIWEAIKNFFKKLYKAIRDFFIGDKDDKPINTDGLKNKTDKQKLLETECFNNYDYLSQFQKEVDSDLIMDMIRSLNENQNTLVLLLNKLETFVFDFINSGETSMGFNIPELYIEYAVDVKKVLGDPLSFGFSNCKDYKDFRKQLKNIPCYHLFEYPKDGTHKAIVKKDDLVTFETFQLKDKEKLLTPLLGIKQIIKISTELNNFNKKYKDDLKRINSINEKTEKNLITLSNIFQDIVVELSTSVKDGGVSANETQSRLLSVIMHVRTLSSVLFICAADIKHLKQTLNKYINLNIKTYEKGI